MEHEWKLQALHSKVLEEQGGVKIVVVLVLVLVLVCGGGVGGGVLLFQWLAVVVPFLIPW